MIRSPCISTFCVAVLVAILVAAVSTLISTTVAEPTLQALYEAPIGNPHIDPKNIVPGSYAVHLFASETLEGHFERLGRDISQHVAFSAKPDGDNFGWWYSTKDVGGELLRLIRSDRAVEVVEYNGYGDVD